jgi:hypothetical protein
MSGVTAKPAFDPTPPDPRIEMTLRPAMGFAVDPSKVHP